MEKRIRRPVSGQYSPLRYPGGKGKVASFIKAIIRENDLSDGCYVEPYAGGAAVAWELLRIGVVRRVEINDISRPIFCFWDAVLNDTDALLSKIGDAMLSVDEWDKQKAIFRDAENADSSDLAFAFFYLNRTNRSGILNGGIIGGRKQEGEWKIDARFPKSELIYRISKIADMRSRVSLSSMDAVAFLRSRIRKWKAKTLVYLDPPYYNKGGYLYYDAYKTDDHAQVSQAVNGLHGVSWIVSYDDVRPIHDLYEQHAWLQYGLRYSARNRVLGREAMFFSPNLRVPELPKQLTELDRGNGVSMDRGVSAADRCFAYG